MSRTVAQLDREIKEALKSVDVRKFYAWRPKLEETLVDIKDGRISHSPNDAALVSRLDHPRGTFFVLDGHHRIVEAILANRETFAIEISPYVPRIERTGGAYQSQLNDKINVYQFVTRRS